LEAHRWHPGPSRRKFHIMLVYRIPYILNSYAIPCHIKPW
jgi:hypothetical protein